MNREAAMKQRYKLPTIALVLCLTAACQQEKADLETYVAQVKAQQKSDIPPIPVMKPYEHFDYAASELRDPFVPTVVDMAEPEPEPVADNGIKPDQNRRKEALEAFELAELQFVGTLEQDQIWALVRGPDGVIHRVQVGNYMGRNHGKIISITSDEIQLREIVPNGRGGFIERDTSVPAVEVK
ncbi:MAG: pilus assembly protein PilP [Methylophaga sp.]|nr:pilus assembly protein PilP [Methylophaga sp.]